MSCDTAVGPAPSRHAWVDARYGVAGDMLLAALLDAGAPIETVQAAVDGVVPDAVRLSSRAVDRAGQRALELAVQLLAGDVPHRRWAEVRGLLEAAAAPQPVRDRALPVPASAVLELARGRQVAAGTWPGELATPTSAGTSPSPSSSPAPCSRCSRRSGPIPTSPSCRAPSTRPSTRASWRRWPAYPSVYVGAPLVVHRRPRRDHPLPPGRHRDGRLTRTTGFVDDTRASLSIPARHDVSRRVDSGFLAGLVAEHGLTMSEALDTGHDLVLTNPRTAFEL